MFTQSSKFKKISKLLGLKKPLIIFDIETTGVSLSSDKIISLAYIKIWPDGRIKKENVLLNPEMEISHAATTIHGIGNEEVADKPTFKEKSQELYETFNDCYYSGYNVIEFDLPVVRREFIRVGRDFEYDESRIIDAKKIYSFMAPGNLPSAYEYYCHKSFAHRQDIMFHTEAAAEILLRQLERYNDVRDWDFLKSIQFTDDDFRTDNIRKFYWKNGEACFAFSKYRDRPLSEVAEENPKYLEWVLKSDFTDETKYIVKTALDRANKHQKKKKKKKE